MNIFSKMKDYTDELDDILDRKYFSSTIKNLLSSMLYRVEISYNDYAKVKRAVRDKNLFIEDILEIIRNYCDHIKAVKLGSEEENMLKKNKVPAVTNERERSALVYPTEKALLFAISDIEPKYFYISEKFIFKTPLQTLLVDGCNANTYEVLGNFNGWSWDTTDTTIKKYFSNLIYQNILLMMGEEFLIDWRSYASSKRDFLSEFRKTLKDTAGNVAYFESLCKILYLKLSDSERKKVDEIIKKQAKEYEKMLDKEKYLKDWTDRKLKYSKSVEYIDKVLNDKELLIKEFRKYNSKLDDDKRLSNIRTYINILENQKEREIAAISECSYLLKPVNYLNQMSQYKAFYEIKNTKFTLDSETINLQLEFLKFFNKKIDKAEIKEDLLNIIYMLRYYKFIKVSSKLYIKDIKEINDMVEKLLYKSITKACKIGAIRIVSMNTMENYKIVSGIINTKIIDLEDVKIKLNEDNHIEVYDKEIIEKDIDLIKNNIKLDNVVIKHKRIQKIFI